MGAYISLAGTVILSIIASTWYMSSRFTKLEMKVDQHSRQIRDLETAINNSNCDEEGQDG